MKLNELIDKLLKEEAVSDSQQRLFGIVSSVISGKTKLKDLPKSLQDKVKKIKNSMSVKEIEKFASTKHSEI